MLIIQQVRKDYAGTLILDIPRLSLEKGVYWLTGANGSGKTTLLRILAGMAPFKGSIFLNNISLHKQPTGYRSQLGWAEAEPLYPPFVTARELIDFYQSTRKAGTKQVDMLINFFGIQSFINLSVEAYSSGMVKRLSLLLAFIGKPALILLDEPLATLDAEAAQALPTLIREYQTAYNTSFIFSSHQPIADNGLIINSRLIIANRTVQPAA
ncbi:MAG: ABC transporter ATP-binding protein [Niastella sp.]|nr:ABC transporter ATP-binding protein [Niastella sp.]